MAQRVRKKSWKENDLKITIHDLPEIAILSREIKRFKKTMLRNPTHEEEESSRAVVERHFLNGLERAREVLLLSHYRNRLRPKSCPRSISASRSSAASRVRLSCRNKEKRSNSETGKALFMKKILVFDEPEIASFIQGAVGERCEVVWTSKDEEVVALFEREKPDIVLMNYEASDCSRFGKLLKEIRSESSTIPILLMSGHDVLSHMPVNVTGGIFKPLQKIHLEGALQRYKIL